MLTIRPVSGPDDLATVRALLAEYGAWMGLDPAFAHFADELASLPGEYAPPLGALLIAASDGRAAGCVAMRALGPGVCEMKRLYVRPEARGTGAGRALVTALFAAARAVGHRRMRLDTLAHMDAALALYQSLGFREIPAYYPSPTPGTRYFERDLEFDSAAEAKGS